MQNSGDTSAKQGYKSTNMAADVGNKLQKYIQEIMSAAAAGNECQSEWAVNISEETKAKDNQILAMISQVKTLTDAFTALTKSMSNKENVPPRTGNTNTGNTPCPFNWTCNMGGTAGHTAITQLAPTTTAAHALRKKMDTRMT
jgi:hypothetical protein